MLTVARLVVRVTSSPGERLTLKNSGSSATSSSMIGTTIAPSMALGGNTNVPVNNRMSSPSNQDAPRVRERKSDAGDLCTGMYTLAAEQTLCRPCSILE